MLRTLRLIHVGMFAITRFISRAADQANKHHFQKVVKLNGKISRIDGSLF